MTREEFSQIAAALKSIYADPKFMDGIAIEVWYKIFEPYPFDTIATAVSNYITRDDFGKAPVPGQIISCIETKVGGISEAEAWDMVARAVANSNYQSEEEFSKLPRECQIAVGSANNLKQLAIMDVDTFNSVEKSTFMHRYRDAAAKIRREEQKPEYITNRIEQKEVKLID